MNSLLSKLREHPAFPRALPFAVYMAFIALMPVISYLLQLISPTTPLDERLIYPIKVACVALLLTFLWKRFKELLNFNLQLRDVLLSVSVGVAVFILWINLDQEWMKIGDSPGFNPRDTAGNINWYLAIPRLMGATLVVPIMEELFWRSFLARWIERPDFLNVTPAQIGLRALLLSSVLFGVEHTLGLAGLIAGLAYGALYILRGKLWAPVLAHATTNGLLGLWVLQSQQWDFW